MWGRVAAASLLALSSCTQDYADIDLLGGAASGGGGTNQGVGLGATTSSAGGAGAVSSSSGGAADPSGGSGGFAGGPTSSSSSGMPKPIVCGDGFIDPGEQCDGGPGGSPYCNGCFVVCAGQFDVLDPATGHCYYMTHQDGMHNQWQPANDWCVNTWGGDHLLIIETQQEMAFVAPNLPQDWQSEELWMSAKDAGSEGQYYWTNGAPWIYGSSGPAWEPGEPGGGSSENCVVIKPNGKLIDISCTTDEWLHQVCERAPVGLPPP